MSITKDQIITVLEEAVEEYGTDHTAQCVYYDERRKEALCIAGVAFVKLGATNLRMIRVQSGIGSLNEHIDKKPDPTYGYHEPTAQRQEILEELLGETFESDAYEVLAHVQYLQDNGSTWGRALEIAKAEA